MSPYGLKKRGKEKVRKRKRRGLTEKTKFIKGGTLMSGYKKIEPKVKKQE